MTPREALEFYRDPANQEPAGPARTREGPRETSMVPVLLSPAVIERASDHAAAEGIAVSTWVRRAVERELDRGTAAALTRLGEEIGGDGMTEAEVETPGE